MKLVSAKLHAPVLRQLLSANVHSQGRPTAFEKMAVFLVETGKSSDELKGQSLHALFELLVGGPAADPFLDETLERLFSPAFAILGVAPDVRFTSFRNLPVSEIEVLANGKELLRSGLFPTRPRQIRQAAVYDPLSGTVEEDDGDSFADVPDVPERALPESLAAGVWPDAAAEDFVRRVLLRPGDTLEGVSREDEGRIGWTTFSATVELDGETLKASSPRPGAADCLNGMVPDDFRRLMLSGLDSVRTEGPVRSLSGVDPSDLLSPLARPSDSESWIWFHPDGETSAPAPKGVRLEVVWPAEEGSAPPEGPEFSVGTDGAPDRIAVPAGPYPDATAAGGLRTFSHVVAARAFFARTPMEIPVRLRERLSDGDVAKSADSLVSALLESGHPRALAHAVVLASEAGAADLSPLLETIAGLDEARRSLVERLCSSWRPGLFGNDPAGEEGTQDPASVPDANRKEAERQGPKRPERQRRPSRQRTGRKAS